MASHSLSHPDGWLAPCRPPGGVVVGSAAQVAPFMPVPPPWVLDIETMVGVAITLLAVLVPVVVRAASRRRARRRTPAVLPSPWRPSDPGGSAPRESDAA